MFRYAITQPETIRWSMSQVPAAGVVFDNPVLRQFHADQQENLCSISLKRTGPVGQGIIRHELIIAYTDPELELIRRLSS